ncbi:MAG: YgiT-type zinc finger protein [Thermodesulfobacteriota bacterium]
MKPFEKCPVCGGGLEYKRVEKLLKGGGNTVSIKVAAEVCLRCSERLYAEDVVKPFEEIHNISFRREELIYLKALGRSITLVGNWMNISPIWPNPTAFKIV